MILTCPDCATRYFVDDAKVGTAGRTVRCAACGARWKAEPELELAVSDAGAMAFEPSAPKLAPEKAAPSELPADELPKVFRARAEEQKKARAAAAAGVIWAGMGAAVAMLLATAVVFRVDVVRLWPRSAGAFASLGLPVNPTGLAPEKIRFAPAMQDGHAALVISGGIRNVTDVAKSAPPVRIELKDKKDKVVATKIADPEAALIPPGEVRYFSVSLLDPPVTAHHVDVSFVLDPEKTKVAPKPAAGPAHAPELRGAAAPAPAEATPVPAGSPYALPANEGSHHG